MKIEEDLLELFVRYKDMELRFKGKPDDVTRSFLRFIQKILPTYDLASKLALTIDLEDLLKSLEGIIAFTPEGPVVMVPKERLGGERDAILLHLVKAYVGYRTGRLEEDSLSTSEIASLTGGKTSTIGARLSELVSAGQVERVGRGEYRMTTLGIRNFIDEVLPKIESGEKA